MTSNKPLKNIKILNMSNTKEIIINASNVNITCNFQFIFIAP